MARPLGAKDKKKRKSRGKRLLEGSAFLGAGSVAGGLLYKDTVRPKTTISEAKKQYNRRFKYTNPVIASEGKGFPVRYYADKIKNLRKNLTPGGIKRTGHINAVARRIAYEPNPNVTKKQYNSHSIKESAGKYRNLQKTTKQNITDVLGSYRTELGKFKKEGSKFASDRREYVKHNIELLNSRGDFDIKKIRNPKRGALIGLGAATAALSTVKGINYMRKKNKGN